MLFKGLKNQNEINKKMKSRISSKNNSRFSKVFFYILKGLVHFAVGKIIKF